MRKSPKMLEIEKTLDESLEDFLARVYSEEGKSPRTIAGEIGVSQRTISRWLKSYKIPTRNLSESMLPEGIEKPPKENLERMYTEEGKSTKIIAEEIGVSPSTISEWLKSYKIPTRKTKPLPEGIEKPPKENLERMYTEEGKTTRVIAEEIGVSPSTISEWLKSYKILTRKTISTTEQFQDFLEQDETARDLAAVATTFNGEAYEIEQVILDLYSHKFKDQQQLHEFLTQQREQIKEMIDQGLTNLGTYLGEFTIGDRRIIPLLIDQTLITIPREAVTPDLEDRMLGMLDNAYSPRFNENPEETMQEIATKAKSPEKQHQKLYTRLLERYQRVMDILDELNN